MTRRRFLVKKFAEGKASLRGEQARHLAKVLRAQPGQQYELSDEHSVWLGKVSVIGDDQVDFDLVEKLEMTTASSRLFLMVSLVKFSRFETVLEKATELGVTEIMPLVAARSVKHLVQAAPGRMARWEKIILNAAQQARRVEPPTLGRPQLATEVFPAVAEPLKVLLSEKEGAHLLRTALRTALGNVAGQASRSFSGVALAIGPEGGWTDEEFDAARLAGFVEASLGRNILRTETAAIAALAVIAHELAVAEETG